MQNMTCFKCNKYTCLNLNKYELDNSVNALITKKSTSQLQIQVQGPNSDLQHLRMKNLAGKHFEADLGQLAT